MRLDGLDQIIMYGTGAYIGHNVMALRMEDDELYIVESQDAWYWPTHGIQRTPFKEWIQNAKNASFNVAWLPLSEESAKKFDVEAATAWFEAHEGLPYGYHNFLFGWIDTPDSNFPPILPKNFVPILFDILSYVIADTVDMFIT